MKCATLKKPCTIQGLGVHTGQMSAVRFSSGQWGQGIRFFCPGLVKSCIDSVHDVMLSTLLKSDDGAIGMVEHMLSACAGLGITDMDVTVDCHEMPILDGSAKQYVDLFQDAGLRFSDKVIKCLVIDAPFQYTEKKSTIRFDPGPPVFDVAVDLGPDYGHHHIYDQRSDCFITGIAPARTFVHLKDIEHLKRQGYIKGGSLDCALVLDGQNVVNTKGFILDNECARHKILDMMGDFYLLGRPIHGTITAHNPGHGVNYAALRGLLDRPDCFSLGEVNL